MTYIAIGKFGWGKGPKATAALKKMRENVATEDRDIYIMYAVNDPDAYVTHMGAIHSKVEPVETLRKNWPSNQ